MDTVSQRRHTVSGPKPDYLSLNSRRLSHSTSNLPRGDVEHVVTMQLFRSATDMTGSAIFYELQKTASDDEDKADVAKRKFNWRVALSPASLFVGLATVFYVSGVGVVYQCLPSLGKASGELIMVVKFILNVVKVLKTRHI